MYFYLMFCERYERLILLSKHIQINACCQLSHKEVVKQQLGDRMLRTLRQFFSHGPVCFLYSSWLLLSLMKTVWGNSMKWKTTREISIIASRNHFNPLQTTPTPWKISGWEPKNHPIKRENHLNQTSIFGFQIKMLVFQRENDQRFSKP